jgi:protoheme IX farnesyltransferase
MNRDLLKAYLELTKPRIVTMVLVTTVLGYALARGGLYPKTLLLWTLVGTAMASGGAGVLNQYVEREVDARMHRTRNRPLPSGTIPPFAALLLGLILAFGGPALMVPLVNPLAAGLALLSALLYVLVYTPLKRYSWLNTTFGAIPGAVPPMIGWAAATGQLNVGAWVLFAILFIWQHPHFYSIAYMFKEDYARGGFKMLPVVDTEGKQTFRHSLAYCIVLIPVSILPSLISDMVGWIYFSGALLLGVWFLAACVRWRISESQIDARKVLRVSVIYLPVLLLLILVDSFLIH